MGRGYSFRRDNTKTALKDEMVLVQQRPREIEEQVDGTTNARNSQTCLSRDRRRTGMVGAHKPGESGIDQAGKGAGAETLCQGRGEVLQDFKWE